MKISEMSFEQGAQVALRIAAPIANICDDEELANILMDFAKGRQIPLRAYGTALPKIVTLCMENHKADTLEIIKALLGITQHELDQANFLDIITQLRDSFDEVLIGFFTRSKPAAKTADTK